MNLQSKRAFTLISTASFALAIVGSGFLTAATFAHYKPVAKCNCSSPTPDANEETQCVDVIEVGSGDVIEIQPVLSSTDPSVTIQATIGDFHDGKYYAPSTLPESGMDSLEVTDQSTGEVLARVGIVVIPTEISAPPVNAFTSNMSLAAVDVEEDYPATSIPDVTEVDPTITAINNEAPLTSVTIGSATGQDVPFMSVNAGLSSSAHLLIVNAPQKQKGKKCGINKKPIWVGKPCSPAGATKTVKSTPKSYKKPAPTSNTGQFGVGANGEVLGTGGGFTSTITANWYTQPAVSVYYIDVYHCKNGVWTFWYTKKCVKDGVYGFGFSPDPLGSLHSYLGFPSDPGFKFGNGDYSCSKM